MSINSFSKLKESSSKQLGFANFGKCVRFPVLVALSFLGALATTGSANAGCGLTVTFDNDLNTSIQILEVDAKTTTGSWKTVYDDAFTIAEGTKVTKAIETNGGCAFPHHLRAKYEKGKNTLYETKGPIATAVDKKINMEFDD
ncbi:hypothetical protein [uncultured Nitrospira sp.]|uniref:hypothetical protein n=1 Tax=uncultured Nitrospira sp. TaxID=157176 RepID=UPI003140C56A